MSHPLCFHWILVRKWYFYGGGGVVIPSNPEICSDRYKMKKVVLMSWPQLRHGEQSSLKPIVNFVHIILETRVTGLGREPNNLIQSLQNQHFRSCFGGRALSFWTWIENIQSLKRKQIPCDHATFRKSLIPGKANGGMEKRKQKTTHPNISDSPEPLA